MAAHPAPTTFEQIELFAAGYTSLTVEFTVHLSGPTERHEVGIAVYDTATREPLLITAFGSQGILNDLTGSAQWMEAVLHAVRERLSPF